MLSSKDIYTHLANEGSIDDLYEALENEIKLAQEKIEAETAARKAEEEKKAKVAELRSNAVAALLDYFAIVNPDIDEDTVGEALDILGKARVETSVSTDPYFRIFTTFRG